MVDILNVPQLTDRTFVSTQSGPTAVAVADLRHQDRHI
jgi:hypothetical protein